jgi:hypothetical protein
LERSFFEYEFHGLVFREVAFVVLQDEYSCHLLGLKAVGRRRCAVCGGACRPEEAEVDHRSAAAAEARAAILCHDLAGAEEHSGRVAAEAVELEP